MINQIIMDLATNNNWKIESGVYTYTPKNSNYTLEDVALLLNQIDINELKQTSTGIVIDNPETFSKIKEIITKPADKVSALSGWYGRYNDLTDKDWKFIVKHMRVKLHNHTSNLIEKDIDYRYEFAQFIQSCLPDNPLMYRLMNDFKTTFARKFTLNAIVNKFNFLSPFIHKHLSVGLVRDKLIFDLNTPTLMWLKKNEWHNVKSDGESFKNDILTGFFHNLRLILQYEHNVSKKISSRKKISIQSFINMLAAKAEITAYDSVLQEYPADYVSDILKQHQRQVGREVLSGNLKMPISSEVTGREKLDTLSRFVAATTMERTVQTLCRCYTVSSRLGVYEALKTDGITLPIKSFNEFNEAIDSWKQYNYVGALHEQNYQMRVDINPKQTAKTENRWNKREHLCFELSPSCIFSREAARHIGIYEAIYGKEPLSDNQPVTSYQYAGISVQTTFDIVEAYKNNEFEKIYNTYSIIQNQNPALPTIKINDTVPPQQLVGAFSLMLSGRPIKDVLTHLGFGLNDVFEVNLGKQIKEHRQAIKIQKSVIPMNNINNQHEHL